MVSRENRLIFILIVLVFNVVRVSVFKRKFLCSVIPNKFLDAAFNHLDPMGSHRSGSVIQSLAQRSMIRRN